jgi:dolichyl-phosphate-mannose--protein O-mannosyl transferase
VNEGKKIKFIRFIIDHFDSRTPIQCDSVIRLMHVTTRRNLHSHNYPSPLSNNQEVSAYGEDGVGDEGDRWKVVCTTKNDFWLRKDSVRFQHVVTGK